MAAGFKGHIGFYPSPETSGQLEGYKHAKGSVRFPLNKPIALELIAKMVKYRFDEINR